VQVNTFEKQRTLYREVLALSTQALTVFGPLIDLARRTEHSSPPSTTALGALRSADATGQQLDAKIDESAAALASLAARRASATPNDRLIEQTLWIGYLAGRDEIWLGTNNSPNVVANHLRDLGIVTIGPPKNKDPFIAAGEPRYVRGKGWILPGHTDAEDVDEGLLGVSIDGGGAERARRAVCENAKAKGEWAKNATASMLLEVETELVSARP